MKRYRPSRNVQDITEDELLRLPGVQERNIQLALKYATQNETLTSLGKDYKISKERTRQIIAGVLDKVLKARNSSQEPGPAEPERKLLEPITFNDLQDFFGMEDGRPVMSIRNCQRFVKRGCMEVTRLGRYTFLTEKQFDEWLERHKCSSENNRLPPCSYCKRKLESSIEKLFLPACETED